MSDQAPTDDEILALAQELKVKKGLSLQEAMDLAAIRLRPKGEIDCEFNLTVTLKPRVAKFFRDEFAGHPTLSVEERLAVYVAMTLNKIRGQHLARVREEAQVGNAKIPDAPQKGERGPMAMSRSAFLDATG